MILSHKHKLIFIKTHKTSTQTFNQFISQHIGSDDIILGDPNQGTEINIDNKLPNGKTAREYKDIYGNHLPWFIVKEMVGDSVWDDYHVMTIERSPVDRLVSLFCFLNPLLTSLKCKPNPLNKVDKAFIKSLRQQTPLQVCPERIRDYFYDWVNIQLLSSELDLQCADTYSPAAIPIELQEYRRTARANNINIFFFDDDSEIMLPMGSQNLCNFPPFGSNNFLMPDQNHRNRSHPAYKRYLPLEGQCRFLNYGYYYDGNDMKVDKVINYVNVGNNIGNHFDQIGINIQCNKELYDSRSENIHFRKNLDMPDIKWWYDTPQGAKTLTSIAEKFYMLNECELI